MKLPEQPGPGLGDRLVLVDRDEALGDADQRPHEPPDQNRDADQDDAQRKADRDVQKSDPECPDLELIMRPQHRVGIVDLDVRNDDADQGRNPREIADAVKNVDAHGERIVGDDRAWKCRRADIGSHRHGYLVATGIVASPLVTDAIPPVQAVVAQGVICVTQSRAGNAFALHRRER
jgi:hypothetical protein